MALGREGQLKKGIFTLADQSKLVSYTESSSEEEEDTLMLILMKQLTCPLIDFLFLK